MKIVPLEKETFKQAQLLINTIFPRQSIVDRFGFWTYVNRNTLLCRIGLFLSGITSLRYWVGINEETGEVIGTTGLYSYKNDEEEAYWLGWYCVATKHQGKGYGSELLNYSINKAKEDNKKYLRLYTSTYPEVSKAQKIYESKGFKIIKEKKIFGTDHKLLYRELRLVSNLDE